MTTLADIKNPRDIIFKSIMYPSFGELRVKEKISRDVYKCIDRDGGNIYIVDDWPIEIIERQECLRKLKRKLKKAKNE